MHTRNTNEHVNVSGPSIWHRSTPIYDNNLVHEYIIPGESKSRFPYPCPAIAEHNFPFFASQCEMIFDAFENNIKSGSFVQKTVLSKF